MTIWYITEDFTPEPMTVVEVGMIHVSRPCVLNPATIKGYLGHGQWTMGVVKENFAPGYNLPAHLAQGEVPQIWKKLK